MDPDQLTAVLASLAQRPGHEKVRTLLATLLTEGLGARLDDVDFESRVPEVAGRIDALFGSTVFEIKSNLRREEADAEQQLARYLPQREKDTGHRYVGIATDGATFRAYEMRDGALTRLGPDIAPDLEQPRKLLEWLEAAVATEHLRPPDTLAIGARLGRGSLTYHRAMGDLDAAWAAVGGDPDPRLKRDLWARLLFAAYGAEVDQPGLFLQHTYLTILAKTIATLALFRLPATARDLLDGQPFLDAGIRGAVESDLFDWVLLAPGGEDLVRRIAEQAAGFDFGHVEVDILKALYEGLIDPAQRHDLGEYYTPDWMAAKVVRHAVTQPLTDRVIDPACGSGTFLFQTVRLKLSAAEAAGMDGAGAVTLATETTAGIDVHPVAVIFARATVLLALAPALARGRPAVITLGVYLGDALQWGTRSMMGHDELEIEVPADPPHRAEMLRFPFADAARPDGFDRLIDHMLRLIDAGQDAAAFGRWAEGVVAPEDIPTLAETYAALKRLCDSGRNHVWGFIVRNLTRPIWLASDSRKADVVVGNPPWVAYRSMSAPMQKRFEAEARAAGLWAGGKLKTHMDLSGYFFARAVDLYMKRRGRIAFVLPYAALSRGQFAPFRSGRFKDRGAAAASVRFTEAWAFPAEVAPLFPVPACVLFAERSNVSRPLPATVTAFRGTLPRRDAHEDEADRCLRSAEAPWPAAQDGEGGSPYRARFNQGATLVPRRLVIVEEVPAVPGARIGANPGRPVVRGRVTNLDKAPWNGVEPLQGPVERAFLRPVLLGESIAPWRIIAPVLGVIPMQPGREAPLDSTAATLAGQTGLADWLKRAEALWKAHHKGKMSFSDQLDYYGKLRAQFPIAPLRVVYAASGVQTAACVIRDDSAVIEHKLYWGAVASEAEAYYLAAILNSETVRARAEKWQSMGQWGARDFDKVIFNLPIPLYDARNPDHRALAALGAEAEALAAAVALDGEEHFTRARRRIRDALADAGLAPRIEAAVAALIP